MPYLQTKRTCILHIEFLAKNILIMMKMTNNLLFIMTLSFSSRHSFQINVGDVFTLTPSPFALIPLFIGITGVRVRVRVGEGNFLLSP